MNTNRCVFCGEEIPEGRMVCLLCENGANLEISDHKAEMKNKYERREVKKHKKSKRDRFYDDYDE